MKHIAFGFVAMGVALMIAGCQPDQPKSEEGAKSSESSTATATTLAPGEWWVKLNKNVVKKNNTVQTTDPFKIVENDEITVSRPSGNDHMCTIVQMSDENDRMVMDDQTTLKMLKGNEAGKDYYYAEIGTGNYYFMSYRVADRFGPNILSLGRTYRVRKSKVAIFASGTIYSLNVAANGDVAIRVHQGEVKVRNVDFTGSGDIQTVGQNQRATFGQATNPQNVTVIADN